MFIKRSYAKSKTWKKYESFTLCESVRVNGKPVHKRLACVTKLGIENIEQLDKILKGSSVSELASKDVVKIKKSREYWLYDFLYKIIKKIWIDSMIDKKYRNEVVTMIINRIIEPRSKLNISKSWYKNKTPLNYIIWQDEMKLHDLYQSLNYLSEDQINIEDDIFKLAKNKPRLILYDITSVYFEWTKCEIWAYWYDRDWNKKSKKIIALWLITDKDWLPISIEVFKWNTPDTKTMKKKILELKKRFGIDKITLVVDRWMNIECNLWKLNNWLWDGTWTWKVSKKDIEENDTLSELLEWETLSILDWIDYITALKKVEINKLIKDKVLTSDKISKKAEQDPKKYLDFSYTINEDQLNEISKFDWTHVISTTIMDEKEMDKDDIVRIYREKDEVEKSFEILKDDLEIRPINHWNSERVIWHVFMCYLSLYVEKYIKLWLKDHLENHSFNEIKDELSSLGIVEYSIKIWWKETAFCDLTPSTFWQEDIYKRFGLSITKPKYV